MLLTQFSTNGVQILILYQLLQPELYQRPHKSGSFLNMHGLKLNPFFATEWNRHWVNEGSSNRHQHPKIFLRNLVEAQSFEKVVLHQLNTHGRRILCRIITGKVG